MIRSTGGAFAFSIGTSEELAGDGYGQPEAEYRKLVGPFGKDGLHRRHPTKALSRAASSMARLQQLREHEEADPQSVCR